MVIAYNIGNPYSNRAILLQEFGIGAIMNVAPIWSLIKFATFVGSHFGPFKGFFRGLGLGIGTLFTLGTLYNVTNAYITKIKIANGILGFIKTIKNFMVSTPREVQAEVEYEELERKIKQQFEEEISDEVNQSKIEKFLLEQEQKSLTLITGFKNLVQKLSKVSTQIPFEKPKRIITDFVKTAGEFVSKNIFKQKLLEFGLIKKIFSSIKKIVLLILGLILTLIALVMIGSFVYYIKKQKNFNLRDYINWLFNKGDNKISNAEVKTIDVEIKDAANEINDNPQQSQLIEVNMGSVKKIIDPTLTKIVTGFGNDFKKLLFRFKDVAKGNSNALQTMVVGMNRIADKTMVFFKQLSTKTL